MRDLLFASRSFLGGFEQRWSDFGGKFTNSGQNGFFPNGCLNNLNRIQEGLRCFEPQFLVGLIAIDLFLVCCKQILAWDQAGEVRLQSKVIFLKQRIEFVIMASRATVTKPHKRFAGYIGQVVQNRSPLPCYVALVVLVNPKPQVAARISAFQRVRIEFIPGELLSYEVCIGFVLVERSNHVVPIAIGGRPKIILLVSIRLGEANQIQPESSPTLPVSRVVQQSIDELWVS